MGKKLTEKDLKLLACPVDKARLEYGGDKKFLVCTKCRTKYLIHDGIPLLMPPK